MSRIIRYAVPLLLVLLGFALGVAASSTTRQATAEVRKSPQPQNVPSGGLQSAATLSTMSATLQSIDARLARIETAVQRVAAGAQQE